jgi:hypothetical protein
MNTSQYSADTFNKFSMRSLFPENTIIHLPFSSMNYKIYVIIFPFIIVIWGNFSSPSLGTCRFQLDSHNIKMLPYFFHSFTLESLSPPPHSSPSSTYSSPSSSTAPNTMIIHRRDTAVKHLYITCSGTTGHTYMATHRK